VVDAKTFVLVENESDLFCCYGESIDNEVVVAIRGGDSEGRPGDMKRHVGSPVRGNILIHNSVFCLDLLLQRMCKEMIAKDNQLSFFPLLK
jgi:hypothetical protein